MANSLLIAALEFSNDLVKNRKRANHDKKPISYNYDEVMAKMVGEKMNLSNIKRVINKINKY